MPALIYFVTFCTWQRLELNDAARQVVMEACQHFHGQRYRIYAGVVMPDHIHLLIQPCLKETGQFWTIGSILHSIKGFSAKQVPYIMPHIGKLWQNGRHQRFISSDRHFRATLNYIYQNPVAAKLVKSPEAYPYLWSNHRSTHRVSVSLTPKMINDYKNDETIAVAVEEIFTGVIDEFDRFVE